MTVSRPGPPRRYIARQSLVVGLDFVGSFLVTAGALLARPAAASRCSSSAFCRWSSAIERWPSRLGFAPAHLAFTGDPSPLLSICRTANSSTATTTTAITMITIVDMRTGYPSATGRITPLVGCSVRWREPPTSSPTGSRRTSVNPLVTGSPPARDQRPGLADARGARAQERRDAHQPGQSLRARRQDLPAVAARQHPVGAQHARGRRGRAAQRAQGSPLPRRRRSRTPRSSR